MDFPLRVYRDKVKWLVDNCIFSVMNKEFTDEFGLFAENSHFLGQQLDAGYYRVDTINGQRNFHYKDVTDFLDKYRTSSNKTYAFEDAIQLGGSKKIIVGFSIHPRMHDVSTYRKNFFDKLFSDTELLDLIRKQKVHLYLYYGYEADNLNCEWEGDRNFEKMLDSTIKDYSLPYNSIIVLSSNLMGYENHKSIHGFGKGDNIENPRIIYDNFYEVNTFKSLKGGIDMDYTFDEYLDNCRNTDKYCLRLNRTNHTSRDWMLYYLEKSKNIKKSIIEHNEYREDSITSVLNIIEQTSTKDIHIDRYPDISKYLTNQQSIHDSIKSKLPIIASEHEIGKEYTDVYSNETIPHDVYKKSIFSWVSTTFPHKHHQIFLNMSTFNPILYYHPLIYIGNNNTVTYLRKSGFQSYEFLYEEDITDYCGSYSERVLLSTIEIDKLFNMDKDSLIDILSENRNIMEFNKQKLIKCDSIRRILSSLQDILTNNNIGNYFQ